MATEQRPSRKRLTIDDKIDRMNGLITRRRLAVNKAQAFLEDAENALVLLNEEKERLEKIESIRLHAASEIARLEAKEPPSPSHLPLHLRLR